MLVERSSVFKFAIIIIVALIVVSYQYVFSANLISFIKLALLGVACLLIINNGFILPSKALIIAYISLLFISFVNGGEVVRSVFAFAGLIIPLLFYGIKLRNDQAQYLFYLLALAPLISVCIGIVFNLIGIWGVFKHEYTGALRLRGATISAHLAFLAITASFASSILIFQGKKYSKALLLINTVIILLTGTRMGIGLAILNFLYVYRAGYFRISRFNAILYFIGLLIICVGLYEFLPVLLERTFGSSHNLNSDYGINASGRFVAWEFYFSEAMQNMYLGSGLGSVVIPFEIGATHFGVPHNEYLRFFYDGGVVGLFAVLCGYFLFFRKAYLESGKNVYSLLICSFVAIYSFTDNALTTLQMTIPLMLILNGLTLRERR